MTEKTPIPNPARPRRSLYRTVLSLAAAAIVAAGLPFSAFYLNSLDKRPTPVSVSAPYPSVGQTRIVTTTSGATRVIATGGSPAANGSPAAAAIPVTPVSTHVS